jgi:tRNA(fMet)-specific endonuclease VapC
MENYPQALREKFNALAEQLCISTITLGELHYGAETSARRVDNLTAIEHFVARLDALPFDYGQVRAELERAGTPCGPHAMQIGGHARSEGLIIVTNNIREFSLHAGDQGGELGVSPAPIRSSPAASASVGRARDLVSLSVLSA